MSKHQITKCDYCEKVYEIKDTVIRFKGVDCCVGCGKIRRDAENAEHAKMIVECDEAIANSIIFKNLIEKCMNKIEWEKCFGSNGRNIIEGILENKYKGTKVNL